MKKLRFLTAFVAFATMLGLTSCSDDPAELLNGGQGPAGSTILNINYTIPGDSTKVFVATSVNATANDADILITAENEDTGESLEISFVGNKVQQDSLQPSYVASVTYIDATGNEYSAMSPFTNKLTGSVRLKEINTAEKTITGVFSFIGYDDNAAVPSDGVPFFSGIFMSIPYTGTLPEQNPTTPGTTYMKATIDGTVVNFATVNTLTLEESTSFTGSSPSPLYSLQLIFFDNSVIVEGATIEMGGDTDAQMTVGMDGYFANEGSITITDVTNNIVTGTFHFTASDFDEVETVEVTAGEFKVEFEP